MDHTWPNKFGVFIGLRKKFIGFFVRIQQGFVVFIGLQRPWRSDEIPCVARNFARLNTAYIWAWDYPRSWRWTRYWWAYLCCSEWCIQNKNSAYPRRLCPMPPRWRGGWRAIYWVIGWVEHSLFIRLPHFTTPQSFCQASNLWRLENKKWTILNQLSNRKGRRKNQENNIFVKTFK